MTYDTGKRKGKKKKKRFRVKEFVLRRLFLLACRQAVQTSLGLSFLSKKVFWRVTSGKRGVTDAAGWLWLKSSSGTVPSSIRLCARRMPMTAGHRARGCVPRPPPVRMLKCPCAEHRTLGLIPSHWGRTCQTHS